jgi:hypothetical protein
MKKCTVKKGFSIPMGALGALLLLGLSCISCDGGSSGLLAPYPIAFGRASVNSESIMFAYDLERGYGGNGLPVVRLAAASESVNPWRYAYRGDYFVMIPKEESGESEDFSQKAGEGAYATARFTDSSGGDIVMTMWVYRPVGKDLEWAGVPNGFAKVLSMKEPGSPEAPVGGKMIAEIRYMDITLPEGDTMSCTAVRLDKTGARWISQIGEKLYAVDEKNVVTQVGYADERVIVTPDSKKVILQMTKALGDRAKWIGIYDGVVYIDPN